ncbi:MAG: hypothetical protein M3O20_03415 [Acidobacteriota bacterium]|nr:hypothetical protein [Acidobacteriota bacterium]
MKLRLIAALLAGALASSLAGCGGDPNAFDEGVAKGIAEAEPFQLDSEQVSMNVNQLTCGAGEELWEAPSNSGERSLSHLQQKGRDLNLTDDVYSGDPGFPNPYTQVRGKFALQVDQVLSIKDGEDKDTKIVQAKVGVKISDPCLNTPLPIMGIRKGKYAADLPVTLRYERYDVGWHLVKILH